MAWKAGDRFVIMDNDAWEALGGSAMTSHYTVCEVEGPSKIMRGCFNWYRVSDGCKFVTAEVDLDLREAKGCIERARRWTVGDRFVIVDSSKWLNMGGCKDVRDGDACVIKEVRDEFRLMWSRVSDGMIDVTWATSMEKRIAAGVVRVPSVDDRPWRVGDRFRIVDYNAWRIDGGSAAMGKGYIGRIVRVGDETIKYTIEVIAKGVVLPEGTSLKVKVEALTSRLKAGVIERVDGATDAQVAPARNWRVSCPKCSGPLAFKGLADWCRACDLVLP